jgi:hypothetical protein
VEKAEREERVEGRKRADQLRSDPERAREKKIERRQLGVNWASFWDNHTVGTQSLAAKMGGRRERGGTLGGPGSRRSTRLDG